MRLCHACVYSCAHKAGPPRSPAYRAPESTASRAREIGRAWGINGAPSVPGEGSLGDLSVSRKERGETMCPAIRHPDSPRLDDPTGRGRPGPRHTGLPSRRQVELGRSVEPGEIKRFSNRHSCRLETHLNPCAPTKPLLLIVTQSPLFCAQIPTTKWAPAALAPRLDDPFRIVVPSDQREPGAPLSTGSPIHS